MSGEVDTYIILIISDIIRVDMGTIYSKDIEHNFIKYDNINGLTKLHVYHFSNDYSWSWNGSSSPRGS